MIKRFPPILFVICLFSLTLSGSPGSTEAESAQAFPLEAVERFEQFVEDQMAVDNAPGLSVGFLKGDLIWTNGYGYSDLENRIPARPESAYRLASVTKTITAIAVLQLVEQGRVDLDAEVQTYIPYFPRKKWPVTVRLLLGHLGGINHYKNYEVEGRIRDQKTTREAMAIFQDWDLVAEPGTRYHYSSYGYNLLGAVIEGATGKSYGHYVQNNIFAPLGMSASRLDDPLELIPNRVRGYQLINGEIKNSEYVDISSRFAAGGTRSTVLDLLKYARGIIDGKLLREETWRRMFSSMATRDGYLTGYGMGWGVRPWRGHFQVSHGGSQPETRTHLLIFPAEEFAVAIASNLERLDLMNYVRRLAELVLDEDLDSAAYVSDRIGQAIADYCAEVFSHGMSQFSWLGKHASTGEKDRAEAFSYFNKHLNRKALEKNFRETEKMIVLGFHPVANQAMIKVGTSMASALKDELGEERLRSYYQNGPLAFFRDYTEISQQWPPEKNMYKFSDDFGELIASWERDWSAIYTDDIRRLHITVKTDFEELESWLKQAFSGKTIYPDFTREMGAAGEHFLMKGETDKAFRIFVSSSELYPQSPSALSSLAVAHIWTGNIEQARTFFKKAFNLHPRHPGVSLERFSFLARRLGNAKKENEVFALADIALELYPRSAELRLEVGNLYLKAGDREKAVQFYKKALELNPNLEGVKEKLGQLEKKKKKQ